MIHDDSLWFYTHKLYGKNQDAKAKLKGLCDAILFYELSMKYLELIANYHVELPAEAELDVSSTIRGVWGRSLRKSNCLQRNIECKDCPFENCNYYKIFEKKYMGAGHYHPYIIQPLELTEDRLSVVFKFFGFVCDNPGQLLLSIIKTDNSRIFNRGKSYELKLNSVVDTTGYFLMKAHSKEMFSPQVEILRYSEQELDSISLEFVTPLRQKSSGNLMKRFEWEPFAKSLIMRIRYIDQFFNHGELGLADRVDLDMVTITQSSMKWQERIRKSYRQQSLMSLGGLIGVVHLENIKPDMAAIIKLGSKLHAGKQCSFGNGFYILEAH